MDIVRYQPVEIFNEMRKLMHSLGVPSLAHESELSNIEATSWMPAVDIREKPNAFLIHADLPGISREDIELSVENNVLTIKGERKLEKRQENKGALRLERYCGSFSRSFTLPNNANLNKISAQCCNGVLEIEIPKMQVSSAHHIEIKEKQATKH